MKPVICIYHKHVLLRSSFIEVFFVGVCGLGWVFFRKVKTQVKMTTRNTIAKNMIMMNSNSRIGDK